MKSNSQSNAILINEIGKKSQLKRERERERERENESIGLTRQINNSSHETRTTQLKASPILKDP
jgi:hypothetical protein